MDYLLSIEQINRAFFFLTKLIMPNSNSFTVHYFVLPGKELYSYILPFLLFCPRNILHQVAKLKDYHLPPLERLELIYKN